MKIVLFLLTLFTCSVTALGQKTYTREKNEKLDVFVARLFPETTNFMLHTIIAGKWGDTLYADKIVVFYKEEEAENYEIKILILQKISTNNYKQLKCDNLYMLGVYPWNSTIESVFFYDTDRDGLKELIVVQWGMIRCTTEFIEYNEDTGENDTIPLSGTCDYCGYSILRQKMNSEQIEIIEGDENSDMECNAEAIREILKNKKKD